MTFNSLNSKRFPRRFRTVKAFRFLARINPSNMRHAYENASYAGYYVFHFCLDVLFVIMIFALLRLTKIKPAET